MLKLSILLGSRYFVWAILFGPVFWISWRYLSGALYYGEFIHVTGELSARLLIITLAVTPLRRLFPRKLWTVWLLRQQRYLGLAAFAYAVPHMIAYLFKLSDGSRVLKEAELRGAKRKSIVVVKVKALAGLFICSHVIF